MSGIGVRENGPTLEGLAQRLEAQTLRLEALERENERTRAENAKLRGKVATLEGSATRKEQPDGIEGPDAVAEERVSRKAMLAKAGAAAVAVAAAGTMLSPREAKAAELVGNGNPGVWGIGEADGSTGVRGSIQSGGTTGYGVLGRGAGSGFAGVSAENTSTGGIGVDGYGDAIGVRGEAEGTGVSGTGSTGVVGISDVDGFSGVLGRPSNSTEGPGVTGQAQGNWPGVWGMNSAGYGGQFEGGKAQLRLTPKGSAGRPRSGSHQKGEIYLDSAATLFVCTRSGTPGTWRKVTTTSA